MGGDRNKDIKYNNAATERENLERQKENDRISLLNENKIRTFEYEGGMESAMQKAELDASANVTAERTKAIKDSSNLLTNFEAQEKRRMLRAKKGVGQVREEDTAITGKMKDEARGLLDRDADYWDARRGEARSTAGKAAKSKYLKETGSLSNYVGAGELATAKTSRDRTRGDGVARAPAGSQPANRTRPQMTDEERLIRGARRRPAGVRK